MIINEIRAKRARKKVAIDPNSKFVRIRDIKKAQALQDARKEAWEAKDRAMKARRTAIAVQNRAMEGCMYEFSAVDMESVVNVQ